MKVCLALGKTQSELLASTTSGEMAEWKAAEDLGILPDIPLQLALIGATLCNALGARGSIKPRHLMPHLFEPDRGVQSAEEGIARLRGYDAAARARESAR